MQEPIRTFNTLIISLIGVAIVIHGIVLEQLLPILHNYLPLKPLLDSPIVGAGVVAILTGTGLYSLIVAAPIAVYLRGGWKLWFPKLDFGGAWIAEICDQLEVCAPPNVEGGASPATGYLLIVEIEQTLFQVNVYGFNEKKSSFSSSLAGITQDGDLRLIYVHRRLVSERDKLPVDTEGVDHLTVTHRAWLGKPKQLHGVWQMCAIPKTRLFRGHSKYVRITKTERHYLCEELSKNPNLELSDFMRWRSEAEATKK